MTASRIPREFIQLLLSRVNIVDLIDGRVPLQKKSSNNYFACCPFHTEKSASFSVAQNKQFYYCFGCGAHGNAIDFFMNYDRLSFPEAVENLSKIAGLEVPKVATIQTKPKLSQNLYELLEKIAKYYKAELRNSEPAIKYLKDRGVSGEIAKAFSIGFAPSGWDNVLQKFGIDAKLKNHLLEVGVLIKKDDGGFYDRFRERIMFPILDSRGRTIGFGGRVLNNDEPKYLNSPETPVFQKGHELYGLHQALETNRQLKKVIIVEGYMDVIALFQHDITYAVATLGTATTSFHLQRLFKHTTEIIFCFDGDKAGKTAAFRALETTLAVMRDDVQIKFMFLPDGEDPDSLIRKSGKEHFESLTKTATPISTMFFEHIGEQTDINTTDGRARFVKLATNYLDKVNDGIFKTMMLDELSKKARIDITKLKNKPEASNSSKQMAQKQQRAPSALRLALSLLIQDPNLAESLNNETIPKLDLEGFDIFKDVLKTIKEHKITNTGALLEFWRDQEIYATLAKLSQIEHMIPRAGFENEFLGAISHLKKQANKLEIENMLAKGALSGLSLDEKKYLTNLINEK